MRDHRLTTVAAVLTLALLSLSVGQRTLAAEAEPRIHKVSIDRTSYAPTIVYLNLGDTVVWTNDDLFKHTVTSEEGGFDSKDIERGETWSYTPTEKGEIDYRCVYHSSMTGRLVVR